MSRIVVALGGNALGVHLPEQMAAVRVTAQAIVGLVAAGHQVAIAHGNGPQVGMIQNAFAAYKRTEPEADTMPLSVCVAMSQGYIGYDLQNALREALLDRGLRVPVDTLLTQVAVDPDDPAFLTPTKPIGAFMTEAEARALAEEKHCQVMEDAGRGWRRVVASPRPKEIIEIATVRTLLDAGQVVIAAGGGGIPVIVQGNHHLAGVSAVIDKDFAAACLAEQIDADVLIILTAVEKVAVDFGKSTQRWLDTLTAAEAETYIAQGQFAAGSMLPKVQATVEFVRGRAGRRAVITHLEKAQDALDGKTGTQIVQ